MALNGTTITTATAAENNNNNNDDSNNVFVTVYIKELVGKIRVIIAFAIHCFIWFSLDLAESNTILNIISIRIHSLLN